MLLYLAVCTDTETILNFIMTPFRIILIMTWMRISAFIFINRAKESGLLVYLLSLHTLDPSCLPFTFQGIGQLLFKELSGRLQSVGVSTIFCWADKVSEGFWLKQVIKLNLNYSSSQLLMFTY